jgi:hypothetical protein
LKNKRIVSGPGEGSEWNANCHPARDLAGKYSAVNQTEDDSGGFEQMWLDVTNPAMNKGDAPCPEKEIR